MITKWAFLSLLLANGPATIDPFAIECVGKAQFSDDLSGKRVTRDYDIPKQTYVFDEAWKRVQVAAIPRQQFDEVCFRGGYIDTVSFSPGLIQVTSESSGRRCDFTVNRQSGDAEYFSHDDLPGGHFSEMKWLMNCTRTEIPTFDGIRNRF